METPIRHPETERVRQHCADLRTMLKEIVEEEHRLSVIERPRLTGLYEAAFGDVEAERQQLAIRSAEIARRVELLSIKVARGEQLTPEIIDLVNKVVDTEYARFRQRLQEAFNLDAEPRDSVAGDEELVNMYRTLAKRLHPDAVGESDEKRSAWNRVQEAYHQRDAHQLRNLLTVLGASTAVDERTINWDFDRWQREERDLETRIRVEQRKLDRLRNEEPFSIAADLEDAQWVAQHRRVLEAEVAARTQEIAEHLQHYADLTGGKVAPGNVVAESKEQQDFNREFMDNTYFNNR